VHAGDEAAAQERSRSQVPPAPDDRTLPAHRDGES
jgi:hypothetical protein